MGSHLMGFSNPGEFLSISPHLVGFINSTWEGLDILWMGGGNQWWSAMRYYVAIDKYLDLCKHAIQGDYTFRISPIFLSNTNYCSTIEYRNEYKSLKTNCLSTYLELVCKKLDENIKNWLSYGYFNNFLRTAQKNYGRTKIQLFSQN